MKKADSDSPPPPFKPPVLKKYAKRWLIEFYAFDHAAQKLKRKLVVVPVTLSAKERMAWAKERMEAISRVLAMGYSFNPKKPKPEKKPPAEAEELTVARAFARMLELVEKTMREETSKSYRTCFKAFLEWADGAKVSALPIAGLEIRHTVAYLDSITMSGKSPYTFNGHLNMLRATAAKMQERGYCQSDFTKGIKRMKVEQAHNTPFTPEEMGALNEWMYENNRPLWMACKMIYFAFIRPIELTRLKVGDIDFGHGTIRCSATTSKNKKLEFVPISKQLRAAMEMYGIGSFDAGMYLFGNGAALTPGNRPSIRPRLSDAHLEAMKACGINGRGKSLYTWKDTGAVNAYRAGIDIKTLQSLLRHSSVAMTEIYLRGLGLLVKENIEGKEW
jgi:site-specific recombinase XerD